MAEQVIHVFDGDHEKVALERQQIYPEHRSCPPPHYDWAIGPVCGCGSALLGSNPPLGGKGEQMDYITIPGRPVKGSRLETEEGFFEYDGKRWDKVDYPREADLGDMHQCENQECADEPKRPMNHDHLLKRGLAPVQGDANHDFAEAMVEGYTEPHNVHLSINTGFMMLPETNACEYIFGEGVPGWEGMLEVWVKHFLSKQADYGDRANDLGLAGQYAELSRKFIKLRRAMWEGHELTQESLKEVLLDLIGHGFLSLMYVENPHFTIYPKGTVK